MAYTALDLVNLALRRAGDETQVTTLASATDHALFLTRALDYTHKRICGMASWDWLRAATEIQLYPVLGGTATITGTALSSLSSTDGTLSYDGAADPVSPYIGAWVQTSSGSGENYRITAVGSNSACTLNDYYGSNGSGQTVTIAQDGFDLPSDFDRPLNADSFVTAPWAMEWRTPEDFLRARALYTGRRTGLIVQGKPQSYTLWGINTASAEANKRMRLFVDPFPDVGETVVIHYFKKPSTDLTSDSAYPLIPEKDHDVLIAGTLYRFFRDRLVDLNRAGAQKAAFVDGIRRMLGQSERTSDRPTMQPTNYRS